jgi:uncharacterized protein YprB with RNaseH-like and TPR domain
VAQGFTVSRKSSLSSRLSRLKKDGLTHSVQKIKTNLQKIELTGWEQIDTSVWRRSVFKDNILPRTFQDSLLLQKGTTAEELIFYDTETTGLSTGAGTIPFLIGFGRVKEEKFEIIQYFLADYPGETFMLESLKKEFPENSYYVSYNGKSYDSHLINSRYLLNGIDYKRGEEIDLLYLSRRLWKNKLENCKLGTIEEKILKIKRGPDIPGSEIPDVWFDFLKTGHLEKLKLVFSHNLQDIYTLSTLLVKINEITETLPENENYDIFNLGKLFLLRDLEKGIQLLNREITAGNREAAQFLSILYKRQENWDSAIAIWKNLNKNGFNLFATVELAKYYEHKIKAPGKALRIIDKLLKSPFSPSGEAEDKLQYRRKRLLRKLNKE